MAKKHLRVGFLFGPGGYTGAWIAGFITRLLKYCSRMGFEVVVIGGVSVGAIIAGFLSQFQTMSRWIRESHYIRFIFELLGKLGPESLFDFNRMTLQLTFWNEAITEGKPTTGIVDGTYLDMRATSGQKIVDNKRVLFAVTVIDEDTGVPRVITNRDEACKKNPDLIVKAIQTSAAMTPFNPPVEWENGALEGDCGLLPLDAALGEEPDVLFILLPYPKSDERPNRKKKWWQRIFTREWWGKAWGFRSARMFSHLVRLLNDAVIAHAIERMKHRRASGEKATLIIVFQMIRGRPSIKSWTFDKEAGDIHAAIIQGDNDAMAEWPEAEKLIRHHYPDYF